MADVREKRVELILQQLDELPTLPTVATRVLAVTGDDLSSARQVVDLISSDPALTARILQLVHRADSGIRTEIQTLDRAVVLLGFDAIRSAVLSIAVFQSFNAPPQQGNKTGSGLGNGFSRDEFWKHCVAVACCAELLAEAMSSPVVAPGDAFVCGLLHDMGKVALDWTLPKSFGRVVEAADLLRGNIADVERTVIGLDHMVVGKRLAERWKLPATIRDCIWLHGQEPKDLPASVRNPRLVNLVTLADLIVREGHLGYSGNYLFPIPRQMLMDALGLNEPMTRSATARLLERIEPRAQSLGLGNASTAELFQQALAQANKELGRMSGQLAAKNHKLSVRAQYFEALSKFQAELRPDAPPGMVLQAIAQTAVGVLGVSCVAAFSSPPNQDFAETLLCDDQGQAAGAALVDLPTQASKIAAANATADADRKRKAAAVAPHRGATKNALSSTSAQRSGPAAGVASPAAHPGAPMRPVLPRAGEGPVLNAGEDLEWLVSTVSPRLAGDRRFWICLEAEGNCIGGVVWGAGAGEGERLSSHAQEIATITAGWALALRTAQIREEARSLAEQLAEANRRLQSVQSEMVRSRALITVGEMAAGAAHEMNNPLAVISGRSQLLATQLTDPRFKATAQLVALQADRLSQIISELMDFARPMPAAIKKTDLSEVMDCAIRQAKRAEESTDMKIETAIDEAPPVAVDVKQVSAAVAAVIENAIQATAPTTGCIQVHAGYDRYSERVVLTVTDNGCGMDQETLKRAFDPFFSAKPAGRRRGLGLSKAMRWIEASGGSIRLESRPGIGTRAVILLPAHAGASSAGEAAANGAGAPTASRGARSKAS